MSTRGYLGIKKKGELKGQYNHFDSYISGLGKDIIEYLNSLSRDNMIEILDKTFDYIELVDENSKPTRKQVLECKQYCDFNVSEKSTDDWYYLLRDTQGNLKIYVEKQCKYMLNGNNFLTNDIFCEYGYVINLDTNELDIYTFGNLQLSVNLLKLNYEQIEKYFEENKGE